MNCQDAHEMLAAYLDDEVTPDQKAQLQAHVVGCADCRAEMAALWKLQSHLSRALKASAAQVEPSPRAWGRLQTRLAAAETTMPAHDKGWLHRLGLTQTDHRGGGVEQAPVRKPRFTFVLSMTFVVLLALGFVGLVIIKPLLDRQAAGGQPGGANDDATPTVEPAPAPTPTMIPDTNFIPLSVTRLPNGVFYMLEEEEDGSGSQRTVMYNRNDDRFVSIVQRATSTAGALPQGEAIQIGGLGGVLQTDLSGSITFSTDQPRTIAYTGGIGLTWDTPTGTRVEIVSSLPQPDVLSFAETLAITFAPFRPTYQPPDFYAGRSAIGVATGMMLTEDRHYGNDRFAILNQQPDLTNPALGGEPITIGSTQAVIYRNLQGEAHLADDTSFQNDIAVQIIGGGGGGGGGSDGEPQLNPPTITYTDGIRLVWSQNGVWISLLTNLPETEAIQVAESLAPGAEPELVSGPLIDVTQLPTGGALPCYEVTAAAIPGDFYSNTTTYFAEDGHLLVEARYNDNDHFVILTSREALDQPLPEGQPILVQGQPAVLVSGLAGEALLKDTLTMQDGQERFLLGGSGGGGGAPEDVTPTWPDKIPYSDGVLVTWTVGKMRLSLLSNLSEDETLALAESVRLAYYVFTQPARTGAMIKVYPVGFSPLAPTYMTEGLEAMTYLYTGEDSFGLLFSPYQFPNPDRFLEISQRAAAPGEALPDSEPVTINSVQGVIETGLSGTYTATSEGLPDGFTVDYTGGVRITWIVNGVRLQILTNVSPEEALQVAAQMVPVE